MQEFSSKIDLWLLAVLVIFMLVCAISALSSIRKGGFVGTGAAVVLVLLGILLPGWVLTSTEYAVAGQHLLIRCGPFTSSLPIASITAVRDTNNSRSSPALSLDRLEITYGNGRTVMISPKDKRGFRQAIGHPEG